MTTGTQRDRFTGGLNYGRGVTGKGLFRVRDRHIAGHLIPLIQRKAAGAAKLDLALRSIALLEDDLGNRKEQPGFVLPSISWEVWHDLCRGAGQGADEPRQDSSPTARKAKRNWVDENLTKLEDMGLVRRDATGRAGKRPKLYVCCDDGTGGLFDDPRGGGDDDYTTILGAVFSSGAIRAWDGRRLTAYLAAMYAERFNSGLLSEQAAGVGDRKWFRSPAWFADKHARYGPPGRTKLPISEASLIAGLRGLETDGLISHKQVTVSPANGQRLQGRRNLYTNNFRSLISQGQQLTELEREESMARALAVLEA